MSDDQGIDDEAAALRRLLGGGRIEVRDGPRGRWLIAMRARFTDRIFTILEKWPAWKVDRVIRARFIPFEDSRYAMEEETARKRGRTTHDPATATTKTARDPATARRRRGGDRGGVEV